MNNMPIGISLTVSAVDTFTECHITKHLITFTEIWEETASFPQGKTERKQQQPEEGYVLSAVQ
jgi:hypothetical protein